jgi:acetoin utilization protein AcuB
MRTQADLFVDAGGDRHQATPGIMTTLHGGGRDVLATCLGGLQELAPTAWRCSDGGARRSGSAWTFWRSRCTLGRTVNTQERSTVRDWMTRRPVTVSEECAIERAIGQMRTAEIRHLVVVDGDRVTGIVSNRDLRRLLEDPSRPPRLSDPVRRIMTEDPVTAAPEMPVTEAARLLLERKIGALPVRDGDEIIGIFTTSDALEALLALADPTAR